jgi:RND family efflux transporter MFP subunit
MSIDELSKLKIDQSDRDSGASGKHRKTRLLWWTLMSASIAVVLAALGWSGLLSRPVEVRAVKVARTFASRALTNLNASGYVVAQRKAAVSSKATGRLARLYVEEGKVIKAGEIIASLENQDLEAILEEARAGLSVARALLNNAEAELQDATLQYNRQKALKEAAAVSEQAFDAAEARYRKGIASEASARFGVEKARASVLVAEVNLEYSLIRAPFDGVILTKNADEGEVVAPFGGAVNSKAAVVTMADMNSLLVEVDVSESSIEKVKVGGATEIRLDALPSDRFAGKVHMIVPTADRAKATVLTKVKFLDLDERVLPEMSAKVAFLSRPLKPDENEPFLGIPRLAVLNSPAQTAVFLIKGRRVKVVPVRIGREWDETVEVLSGLEEGDSVVLNPEKGLVDGARIQIKE